MDMDAVVVLCLAVFFFGGIGYLAYKERGRKPPQDRETPPEARENNVPKRERKRKK